MPRRSGSIWNPTNTHESLKIQADRKAYASQIIQLLIIKTTMYKFVKVKSKGEDKVTYKEWFLLCTTIDLLRDFQEKIQSKNMLKGITSHLATQTTHSHPKNKLESIYNYYSEFTGECICQTIPKLEHTFYLKKLEYIRNKGAILIRESGSFMPFNPEEFQITDSAEKRELEYPSDTEIKIIRWPGGTHYYAKVGNMDIVDQEGNQKWNTEKEARQKAKQYLRTLK